jgi:predicted DNA-binding transcriptional regulator YafY
MPESNKSDVILRQWEMLRLVPPQDQPGRSAQELVEALCERGFVVTRRTVERDLEKLQQVMPLEVDAAARPQRWRWRRQEALDIPGMEVAEAMALYMMRDALRGHLPACFQDALRSRFQQAEKTLQSLVRSGSGLRWSDKARVVPSHVVLQPPAVPAELLRVLQDAVLREVAVEVEYRSLDESAPSRRVLYPRALLLRGSTLYLIAHQRDRDGDALHFAVQRFASVRCRELEPWPPGRFSLDAFLEDGRQQFGTGEEIRLEARIAASLARILEETPLGEDMTLVEKDGARILTARVRDTWALVSWILGHGENIEVLAPAGLRRRVAARLQAAASAYG